MACSVLLNFNIFNGYKQIDNCDKKIESRLKGSAIINQSAEQCCPHQTATTSLSLAKTQLCVHTPTTAVT